MNSIKSGTRTTITLSIMIVVVIAFAFAMYSQIQTIGKSQTGITDENTKHVVTQEIGQVVQDSTLSTAEYFVASTPEKAKVISEKIQKNQTQLIRLFAKLETLIQNEEQKKKLATLSETNDTFFLLSSNIKDALATEDKIAEAKEIFESKFIIQSTEYSKLVGNFFPVAVQSNENLAAVEESVKLNTILILGSILLLSLILILYFFIKQSKNQLINAFGQIEAINSTQPMIEFKMDGTILYANDQFLNAMGYTLSEVKGQHHRIFAETAFANSEEYRQFWANLNRGEYQEAEYKRIGKGGKEVW
ncbi:MAG: PAS domain S-box protein, partial [Leptospira sp.]|nr:PAS domain S-box protein [Leptospira sp.]